FPRPETMTPIFRAVSTLLLLSSTVLPVPILAQGQIPDPVPATGRIIGQVMDSRTGQGLSDVAIQVVGTTTGTSSGLDGRYGLGKVTAGTVTLHIRRLGFAPKTITGIMLDAGRTIEQDISLDPVTVSLETQIVTASVERGSVSAALDKQRTATGVVNSVTREQISRSPDSDAAQAVQRVSGVTVQDGKYVFVRGLGERYTTTSLNGARIPSPEPERKVVPLDLFPSSLIQSVTTSKNFTADQPGDFSGAQVDIRTREFPLGRETEVSTSFGYNLAARNQGLVAAPTLGGDWLGFAGSERQLPSELATPLPQQPSQSTVNSIVQAFRNAWSPLSKEGAPNRSFSITTGGSKPFGNSSQAGYVAALSYSYNQELREREVRAYAEPTNGTTEVDRFEGSTGRASVLWGGIANLSLTLGASTRISLNNTYNHTADNEARRESGFSENLGTRLLINRLRFVERTVRSNQIAAERQLGSRQRVSLSFTNSRVNRSEPDRSEFVQVEGASGELPYWLDATEGAVRTFGDLGETSYNTSLDYTLQFGPADRQHELKLGGLHRYTERVARNQVFSIQAPSLTLDERRLSPEQIFDGRFAGESDAVFRVVPLSQGGSYGALDEIGAGYATVQWALGNRYRLITGARLERSSTIVAAEPTVGSRVRINPLYTDVLPSVLLNVKLTDAQNLRVSATRTLSRPEYRELAEVQYRDVIGGENVIGNPELERTLISNFDARWEWYPRSGEVFSLGVFSKRFEKPIERVFLATSGTRIVTFLNADEGDNLGLELDARMGLGRIAAVLEPLTVFSNLTLMKSEVHLGDDPRVAKEDRAMVGQAPSVVNAGLTFAPPGKGFSATVLYNRVGRRIVSASQRPLPVTYEEARSVLDMALRVPLFGTLAAKFDARNLLDQPYLQTQGTVTRESYYAGRVYTVGLNWRP
ncbi:MAG TPA: TonB-dependent receptor, partial [Gemmatimonadaceae bacterium]|nr:TonB-dependent receptor [Gemmatimonadaceae bacterium]